jgi:hypothetical protein
VLCRRCVEGLLLIVQHAVRVALDDVAGWGAILVDVLRDSGGELSREERSWADNLLGVTDHPGSSGAQWPGFPFDAGGLIAVDRKDRRLLVLLARAQETGAQVTVPVTALAQAIRQPTGRPDVLDWSANPIRTWLLSTEWMPRTSVGYWQLAVGRTSSMLTS